VTVLDETALWNQLTIEALICMLHQQKNQIMLNVTFYQDETRSNIQEDQHEQRCA